MVGIQWTATFGWNVVWKFERYWPGRWIAFPVIERFSPGG